MADAIQKIKDLGYEVIQEEYGCRIIGFGVDVIYSPDDSEALQSILNGHLWRKLFSDTPTLQFYTMRASALGYEVGVKDDTVTLTASGVTTQYTPDALRKAIDTEKLTAVYSAPASIEERIASAASAAVGAVIPSLAPNATAAQRKEAVDGARAAALEAVQE